MCGIFLVISKKKLNKKKCINSETFIKSRGPDVTNNSFFFNKRVFLSNSILSITGKIENKNKLSISKSKNYVLSFNGEIFNWRELARQFNFKQSQSDAQLLINLFDKISPENVSKKINGMFAFCVIDKKKKVVNFATDPQGEKKLFSFQNKEIFILSSNINSILSYVGKDYLDMEQIKNYLNSRHFIYLNDTIFKNIKIVSPGYSFYFSLNNFKIKKKIFENPVNWISKSVYLQNKNKNFSEIKSNLIRKLGNQAKIMIPETKFGCILSGGIDSSVQTAIINNFKKPDTIAGLHHVGKDKVSQNIKKFERFLAHNVKKLDIKKKKYLKDFNKCHNIFGSPFLTHSFVGSCQISKF